MLSFRGANSGGELQDINEGRYLAAAQKAKQRAEQEKAQHEMLVAQQQAAQEAARLRAQQEKVQKQQESISKVAAVRAPVGIGSYAQPQPESKRNEIAPPGRSSYGSAEPIRQGSQVPANASTQQQYAISPNSSAVSNPAARKMAVGQTAGVPGASLSHHTTAGLSIPPSPSAPTSKFKKAKAKQNPVVAKTVPSSKPSPPLSPSAANAAWDSPSRIPSTPGSRIPTAPSSPTTVQQQTQQPASLQHGDVRGGSKGSAGRNANTNQPSQRAAASSPALTDDDPDSELDFLERVEDAPQQSDERHMSSAAAAIAQMLPGMAGSGSSHGTYTAGNGVLALTSASSAKSPAGSKAAGKQQSVPAQQKPKSSNHAATDTNPSHPKEYVSMVPHTNAAPTLMRHADAPAQGQVSVTGVDAIRPSPLYIPPMSPSLTMASNLSTPAHAPASVKKQQSSGTKVAVKSAAVHGRVPTPLKDALRELIGLPGMCFT